MWQVKDEQSNWQWVDVTEWDVRGNLVMAGVDVNTVVNDKNSHNVQVHRVNKWVHQMQAGQVVEVDGHSWRWVD